MGTLSVRVWGAVLWGHNFQPSFGPQQFEIRRCSGGSDGSKARVFGNCRCLAEAWYTVSSYDPESCQGMP